MAAKKKTVKKAVPKKTAKKKTEEDNELLSIIQNWNTLNDKLGDMNEEMCLKLLHLEQRGKRRVHMLNRIHARFTKLRSERERIDIMAGKEIKAA